MASDTRFLYAVELDVTNEARAQGFRVPKGSYWVIHTEEDDQGVAQLCVYNDPKVAKEAAKGRDHSARVVKFIRDAEFQKLKAENEQLRARLSATVQWPSAEEWDALNEAPRKRQRSKR